MTSEELVNASITQLDAAHDYLNAYVAANSSRYTPGLNMLITANLSDMLTRIGNLDAVVIADDADVTLEQCQNLKTETQNFANAAQRLQQTKEDVARSISYVNVGLQVAMYLSKADVVNAAKLIYTTLNPSD